MNLMECAAPVAYAHEIDRLELVRCRIGEHRRCEVEMGGQLKSAGHHAAGQADQTEVLIVDGVPNIAGGQVLETIERSRIADSGEEKSGHGVGKDGAGGWVGFNVSGSVVEGEMRHGWNPYEVEGWELSARCWMAESGEPAHDG